MIIETNDFVNALIMQKYTHICVVPCSFAKNVINAVINNNRIEYVPSASEAVACSIAAGLKMAGKKPIVIIQSSGITNMGSCITSLLKPYGVTFPILVSWRTYADGDSEIQHQHLARALPELVHAYGYEYIVLDKNLDNAISQINRCNNSNTICFLSKDFFSTVALNKAYKIDLSSYVRRSEFLKVLNHKFKDSNILFIGTTGNTAREMYSFMPNTNNFYMAGNMGGALSLGLGAAMAGKKVIVCGGDAEFVMHMGGLTTVGRYKDKIELTYILFDNESNKSTGGQSTYQTHVDYINIAKSSNIDTVDEVITDINSFAIIMDEITMQSGIKFVCVKCGLDDDVPRPPLDSIKVGVFK